VSEGVQVLLDAARYVVCLICGPHVTAPHVPLSFGWYVLRMKLGIKRNEGCDPALAPRFGACALQRMLRKHALLADQPLPCVVVGCVLGATGARVANHFGSKIVVGMV